jgi:hypothetical protein
VWKGCIFHIKTKNKQNTQIFYLLILLSEKQCLLRVELNKKGVLLP